MNYLDGRFDKVIKCPKCGNEFNHFDGAPTLGHQGKSGDWRLPMKCEGEDHEYVVVFSEHKGNIYVWVEFPSYETEYRTITIE